MLHNPLFQHQIKRKSKNKFEEDFSFFIFMFAIFWLRHCYVRWSSGVENVNTAHQGTASLTVKTKSSWYRHFFSMTSYVIVMVISYSKWHGASSSSSLIRYWSSFWQTLFPYLRGIFRGFETFNLKLSGEWFYTIIPICDMRCK